MWLDIIVSQGCGNFVGSFAAIETVNESCLANPLNALELGGIVLLGLILLEETHWTDLDDLEGLEHALN